MKMNEIKNRQMCTCTCTKHISFSMICRIISEEMEKNSKHMLEAFHCVHTLVGKE